VILSLQILGRFKSAVADSTKPAALTPSRTEMSPLLQMQVALKVRQGRCLRA
jgi:hypothetical protein